MTRKDFTFRLSATLEPRHLFSVAPGAPITEALIGASDLLDMIEDAICSAATGETPLQGSNARMVYHSLESAKALLDAAIDSLERTSGRHAKACREGRVGA